MEEVLLKIKKYTPEMGIRLNWVDDFTISTEVSPNGIIISANREGLVSLAQHLLTLAQSSVPKNHHIHLDEHNSLEEGSIDLIFQKT